MNEQEVRALVREAIERHLGRPHSAAKAAPYRDYVETGAPRDTVKAPQDVGRAPQDVGRARLQSSHEHPSHIMLQVLPGSDIDDGMCVIEPSVRCNHCGFCQSYGH